LLAAQPWLHQWLSVVLMVMMVVVVVEGWQHSPVVSFQWL
jgi:hypothetical protein